MTINNLIQASKHYDQLITKFQPIEKFLRVCMHYIARAFLSIELMVVNIYGETLGDFTKIGEVGKIIFFLKKRVTGCHFMP